ncbi:MAG: hypothetical protein N2578_07000, partial [Bdellovibrionaceae bacterium]|nr:hypothetical protein [Pseudobdellovibrionaceae bacterium]
MQNSFLVLVSNDPKITQRTADIAKELAISLLCLATGDEMLERESEIKDARVVIIGANTASLSKEKEAVGLVQTAKQLAPKSQLIVVLESRVSPDTSVFLKKSGANFVLLENEYLTTSKPEFVLFQFLKSEYLPVKSSELKKGTQLGFTVWHLMPAAQRWIALPIENGLLSEARKAKIDQVGEVYVHRSEIANFISYIETNTDKSAAGLTQRTRGKYLELCSSFADLVLLLTDQSESSSFQKGKSIYDQCQSVANDLLTYLASVGDAWDIIDNSSIGGFGSIERAPSIAAFAGLLSLQSSISNPSDCMIAALLMDIGMLELSPQVSRKIRNKQLSEMTSEELAEYQKHPIFSINYLSSRRVPVPETIKQSILHSHERADGKGFPYQPRPEKISDTTWILQLCELID